MSTKSKPKDDDSWDPKPHERSWYSHRTTGDRAWLVRRNGEDFMFLDQPMMPDEFRLRRYRQSDWIADPGPRQLQVASIARVAFAADAELRKALGVFGGPKSWEDLRENERIGWLQGKGPEFGKDTPRQRLFRAIYGAIQGLAR